MTKFAAALLLGSVACAAPAWRPAPSAMVVPFEPILEPVVAPKPIVLPAPVALPAPVPLVVHPELQPVQSRPGAQTPPGSAAAPTPGQQGPEKKPEKEGATRQSPNKSPPGRRPPVPPVVSKNRPECRVQWVPHAGGDDLHNTCADHFPPNRRPGFDALVNGKQFDALQADANVLWEIKTDRFDRYSPFIRQRAIEQQVPELLREAQLAESCGYEFRVGVSSALHRDLLLGKIDILKIVVTGC